jgi:hypothetical protein
LPESFRGWDELVLHMAYKSQPLIKLRVRSAREKLFVYQFGGGELASLLSPAGSSQISTWAWLLPAHKR